MACAGLAHFAPTFVSCKAAAATRGVQDRAIPMEVSLVEAAGIPEGCLISVRAGSTRRQAPVEANKPCKLLFPEGVSSASSFNVDLLAPLGNTSFEVSAAQEKYPFEVKSRYGGKSMHLTLRVREDSSSRFCTDELDGLHNVRQSIGDNLAASIASESPARRHQAAIEQRAYLDSHDLLPWVNSLMQDLIRDRPGDPWKYIDAITESARRKSAPSSKLEESPEKKGKDEKAAKVREEMLKSGLTTRDIDALRNSAQESLANVRCESSAPPPPQQASPSAKLSKSCIDSVTLKAALREAAMEPSLFDKIDFKKDGIIDREEIEYAVEQGIIARPAGLVTLKEQELRRRANEALARGNGDAHFAAVFRRQEGSDAPEEDLRQRAVLALQIAATEGRLPAAAAAAQELPPATPPARPREALAKVKKSKAGGADRGTESLRQQAKQTLLMSAANGQLKTALTSIEPLDSAPADTVPAVQELPPTVSSLQELSAPQGVLANNTANSTGTTMASTPLASPPLVQRDSARVTPGDTLKSPVTLAPPANMPRAVEDDVRQQAQMALFGAASDGRLLDALNSVAEDGLREKARETLLGALKSGNLSNALAEVKDESNMRNDAKQTLLGALQSGNLLDALADVRAEKELREEEDAKFKDMCQRTRQTLARANNDGSLEAALNDASSDTSPKAQRRRLAEDLFKKIDTKKDGVIDRSELDYAIENGIIKRPAGFATLKEGAAARERRARESSQEYKCKPSVGQQSRPISAIRRSAAGEAVATEQASSTVAPVVTEHTGSTMKGGSSSCSALPPARPKIVEASQIPAMTSDTGGLSHSKSTSSLKTPLTPLTPLYKPGAAATVAEQAKQSKMMFLQDNEALRRENARLKKLREAGDTANKLCTQNDMLRSELGKLLVIHRKGRNGSMVDRGF